MQNDSCRCGHVHWINLFCSWRSVAWFNKDFMTAHFYHIVWQAFPFVACRMMNKREFTYRSKRLTKSYREWLNLNYLAYKKARGYWYYYLHWFDWAVLLLRYPSRAFAICGKNLTHSLLNRLALFPLHQSLLCSQQESMNNLEITECLKPVSGIINRL